MKTFSPNRFNDLTDFDSLVGEVHHTCYLPIGELELIEQYAANKETIVIAVQWNKIKNSVKFLMANLATVSVPCSMFEKDENGFLPWFPQPCVKDYGFVVKFGNYKANLHKVLYLSM